ncbi:hypothetical protein DPM19_28990 [Actinomadura craniellae]|uniref:Uncharacterized protein n=1 Tax=Actinomadura craniellae TaxID=2231787 RepID=A0A365GXY7_9ACTN|nr:hypothetical protein DPM19_28990 [Actinomadura craniellae]
MEERNRRRLVVVGAGTASVGLLVVTTLVILSATAPGESPAPEVPAGSAARPAQRAAPVPATGGDAADLPDAVAFLRRKDPQETVVKHVRQVSRSGAFLRVYTDLKEGDENSRPAISLCEWTAQYLRDLGAAEPIVFVHARENDNGHVVLANKQSAADDCAVGDTR